MLNKGEKRFRVLSKNKSKQLGNYPMRKWEGFEDDIEALKNIFGVSSAKIAIQLTIKEKLSQKK